MKTITNWYVTRLHYADETSPDPYSGTWRSMCGSTWGKTPEADAAYRKSHGYSVKNYNIPLCKNCQRKASKG